MTDDQTAPQHGPAPQYGEYATPEQQAAAMGREYVPATPVSSPAGPSTSSGSKASSGSGATSSGSKASSGSGATSSGSKASSGSGATSSGTNTGHFIDRFVTAFQLGIGVVALVVSDWFHVAEGLNAEFAQAGVSTRVPTSLDRYGWVLLGVNILFLAATIVWASANLRRGKRAYYIPFLGYIAFTFTILGGIVAYLLAR